MIFPSRLASKEAKSTPAASAFFTTLVTKATSLACFSSSVPVLIQTPGCLPSLASSAPRFRDITPVPPRAEVMERFPSDWSA